MWLLSWQMPGKGRFLSSKCLQEPRSQGRSSNGRLSNQPHPSQLVACLAAWFPTGFRAGSWAGGAVLSLVPMSADEGHLGSEQQWDLHKDTLQGSAGLPVYRTPCQVLFALHHFASDVPGLSVGWRCVKQEQGLSSGSPSSCSHRELFLPHTPFPCRLL